MVSLSISSRVRSRGRVDAMFMALGVLWRVAAAARGPDTVAAARDDRVDKFNFNFNTDSAPRIQPPSSPANLGRSKFVSSSNSRPPALSPVWHGRRCDYIQETSCDHEDDIDARWHREDAIAATASGSSSSFTLSPHRGAALNSMDAYSARSARSSAGCGRENAA